MNSFIVNDYWDIFYQTRDEYIPVARRQHPCCLRSAIKYPNNFKKFIMRIKYCEWPYSQQLGFQQGAVKMSNRSVCEIHEDCEPSGNAAENSSAKSIRVKL